MRHIRFVSAVVGSVVAAAALAAPTQAEPTQAEPTQAEPTQAEPTQTVPADAAASVSAPDRPDVVLARAAEGKKLHFPNAERLADGSVVAVAREGAGHTGQDGRLLILQSDDDGRTWTTPEVVLDTAFDDRDPMITQSSSGRLLLSWFQIDYSVSPAEPMGTFVAHSDDDGATWSEPVVVESAMSGESDIVDTYELGWAASHGQIKDLGDGELIIPLYGTTPDDPWQRARVVRSLDDGATWQVETEAEIAAAEGVHYQEPVLTVLPDGRVHALLRVGTAASTMGAVRSQESWSGDGGRTWSTPTEIDLVTSSAHTEVLTGGAVFLAYGDLSGQFTGFRGTVGAVVRDTGLPWNDPARELVYDSGTGDQANPAVVEVRPGRVLVIGFDSDSRELVGTFVDPHRVRHPRPDPHRVDLNAAHDDGTVEIDTDLTYTDPTRPGVGPLGAIDGVAGYHDASWAERTAPAAYEITLDGPARVSEVGVTLKPGYASSAVVEVRSDGTWREAGVLDDRVRWGADLSWFPVHGAIDGVRVRVGTSDGWAVLAEVGLRAPGGRLR